MAGIRRRLTGVHSWAGVVFGGLLFVIFWMGTLSVFDREIDRWMMPATRLAAASNPQRLDPLIAAVAPFIPSDARQWRVDLPTPRTPVLRFTAQRPDGSSVVRLLDPSTLVPLPDPGTLGASGFFFPFHYGLHLPWMEIGKWMVGAASMAMLVLLVAGLVIHRKLLKEFFTFRPAKRLPRSTLDLHNVTGVLGVPFHILITLSGLVIFNIYFPFAYQAAYETGAKGKSEFQSQSYGRYTRPRSGAPAAADAPVASFDAMAAQASDIWGGGAPYFVRVWLPGDANSYVELRRSYSGEVTMNIDQLYFDPSTGKLLKQFSASPVMKVQRFISGMHFIQFNHWPLRWLYFALGLTGCMMIATGLVFWLAARPGDRHGQRGVGPRVMQATSIGSITGVMMATLAYLAANRVLPVDATIAGLSRSEIEVWVFCMVWLASFLHATRGDKAWLEQAWVIAWLAGACMALNVVTTSAYTQGVARLSHAVVGVDAVLLAFALLAAWSACRLRRGVTGKQTATRPHA